MHRPKKQALRRLPWMRRACALTLAAALTAALTPVLIGCAQQPESPGSTTSEPSPSSDASSSTSDSKAYMTTDYTEVYRLINEAQEARYAQTASNLAFYETAAADGEDIAAMGVVEEEGMENSTFAEKSASATADAGADVAAEQPVSEASDDYSGTNVQVKGIDEGDITKTDGTYIYRLSAGEDIVVLRADGTDSAEVARIGLDTGDDDADNGVYTSSYPEALYLEDNLLVVIRSVDAWSYYDEYDYDDDIMPLDETEDAVSTLARIVGDAVYASEQDEAADETDAPAPATEAQEAADETDDLADASTSADTTETSEAADTTEPADETQTSEAADEADDTSESAEATEPNADYAAEVPAVPIDRDFIDHSALSGSRTVIDVFDVSDPTAPAALYQSAQGGSYYTSRLSGGILTLLTNSYVWDVEEADQEVPATYVPSVWSATPKSAGQTDAAQAVPVADICVLPSTDPYEYQSFTTVGRVEVVTGSFTDTLSVLGAATDTYMSPNALYLAQSSWETIESEPYEDSVYTVYDTEEKSSTTITRLPLSEDGIELGASCTLPGTLRNQFNMDEYEGYLRVAVDVESSFMQRLEDPSHDVVSYRYGDDVSTNALYVLNEAMEVVGSLEDLAPDEDIKSVRFNDAVGYVVTFEEIDPLFAIDLADPANPTVLSALKIPGFSSYLHPFGEGRLLGFGENVADNGVGGLRTDGLKLSMFDTSDPADVTEIATLSLDGTYSEGLSDHKAVFVSVKHGLVGVPVDEGYQFYTYTDEDGFQPFALSDDGLALEADSIGAYGQPRGLFSGDDLYVVSDWTLVAYSLSDGELLCTLPFKELSDNRVWYDY